MAHTLQMYKYHSQYLQCQTDPPIPCGMTVRAVVTPAMKSPVSMSRSQEGTQPRGGNLFVLLIFSIDCFNSTFLSRTPLSRLVSQIVDRSPRSEKIGFHLSSFHQFPFLNWKLYSLLIDCYGHLRKNVKTNTAMQWTLATSQHNYFHKLERTQDPRCPSFSKTSLRQICFLRMYSARNVVLNLYLQPVDKKNLKPQATGEKCP